MAQSKKKKVVKQPGGNLPGAKPEQEERIGQRPIKTLKFGRVRAAIFKHSNDERSWYTVSLSRSYFADGEWRHTSAFSKHDVLALAAVATEVSCWIEANPPRHYRRRAG